MQIDYRKYSSYVKALGQWHLCRVDRVDGRTLCGVPMLGNNYRMDIKPDDRRPCEKCFKVMEEQDA